MGDMADFHLDEMIEEENRRSLFHSGRMTEQEAFDNGYVGVSRDITSYAGDYSDYSNVCSPESLDAELVDAEAMLSGGGISYGVGHSFQTIKVGQDTHILSREDERELFVTTLREKYSKKYTKSIMKGLEAAGVLDLTLGKSSKADVEAINEKLMNSYPAAYEGLNYLLFTLTGSVLSGKSGVNAAGVRYAQTRENPTCNICEKEMLSRHGKYGKFYYCKNYCKGQPTVSDSYWQKFKEKVR